MREDPDRPLTRTELRVAPGRIRVVPDGARGLAPGEWWTMTETHARGPHLRRRSSTTRRRPTGGTPSTSRTTARLRRSRTDRKVAGVAGGLGRHLDVDPTILRVLFVVLMFFGGAGLLLYGVLWLLVPDERTGRAAINSSDSTRNAVLIGARCSPASSRSATSGTATGSPGRSRSPRSWSSRCCSPATRDATRPGPRARPSAGSYGPAAGRRSRRARPRRTRRTARPRPPPRGADPVPPPAAPTTETLPVPPTPPGATPPPQWYPPVPPAAGQPRKPAPCCSASRWPCVALGLGVLGLADAVGRRRRRRGVPRPRAGDHRRDARASARSSAGPEG